MTRSDNRRRDRTRHAPLEVAAVVATAVGFAVFLVLAAVVTSRVATDALRRGDVLARLTVAAHRAPASTTDEPHVVSVAASPGATTARPLAAPGRASGPGARPAAARPSRAAGSAPAGAPAHVSAADASLPHVVAVPQSTVPLSAAYVAPTVVATAVTGCAATSGGGVVTYTVAFRGGHDWSPGSNSRLGVYTIRVVGGAGPHSGLDAVITGAAVTDTADAVQTYVAFPAALVLDARC